MATGEDVTDSTSRRCFIVDESAFEEQFLRCHVCQEKFDQKERHPKALPCNHTFCLMCLKQVYDAGQQGRRRGFAWADEDLHGVLKCPECRVEVRLTKVEISALPNDHRIIQMIDFLSKVVVKSKNVCPKHEHQPLNFFCKHCLIPVCRDCTVLDHKEQEGHIIVDMAAALNESADDFNNTQEKSQEMAATVNTRSNMLANASKKLDLLERNMRSQIKDTFIEYRLLLERRQAGLIETMQDIIKGQKTKINSRFVELCQKGNELQKMHSDFSQARGSNDVNQLFTVHQAIKDREAEYALLSAATDDDIFVSCEFILHNEAQFFTEMSSLGEVQIKDDPDLKIAPTSHELKVLELEKTMQYRRLLDEYPSEYASDDDGGEQEPIRSHCSSSQQQRRILDSEAIADDILEAVTRMGVNDETSVRISRLHQERSPNTSPNYRRNRAERPVRVVRHPPPPRRHTYSSARYSSTTEEPSHDT